MTDKKKFEVVDKKKTKNDEWTFKNQVKRNGTLYKKDCVCPKEKVEEMKKLGFIEKA